MSDRFTAHLKKRILTRTSSRLKDFTPSLDVIVYSKGKLRSRLRMGQSHKFYDLASLTKTIFTVSSFMQLVDNKTIRLNDPVQKYLPWWRHRNTRLRDLLSHSAGLPNWAPLYKLFKRGQSTAERREAVRCYLAKLKLTKGKRKAIYSDLDFILLGFVIEAVTGQSLLENWLELNKKLKLKSLHFVPLDARGKRVRRASPFATADYAPTEACPWRKKTLRGEVHDDNTWAMGGVSAHAGLFGRIEDVAKWGLLLRQAYKSKLGSPLCSHRTARLFCRRAVKREQGDWALGLMMPSAHGSSSGRYFSKKSVGHTGFTGTSIWYDPRRDLLVVILSNRVHPTRDNVKFRQLRAEIHDFIVEGLVS